MHLSNQGDFNKMNETASIVLSVISMLFYSVVYFPQFHVIYKDRSSAGLSLIMLLIWCQADALSLYATILLTLSANLVIVGWFHTFMGFFMIVFAFYFKHKRRIWEYITIILFMGINFTAGIVLAVYQPQFDQSLSIEVGEAMGWFTTCMYIIGRLPQIILNYKRQSTEGLSILMYIFTICGNLFYIASVFVYSIEPEYVTINMPWIVFTIVTFMLDILVIGQSVYYKRKTQTQMTDESSV